MGASGQNIYPEELESLLNTKYGVAESVVVLREEKLVALINPDSDIVEKEELDQTALEHLFEGYRKEINEKVSAYMQIVKVEIHEEEFEKTPKRSIKRFLYS